jgi:tetratricopeptide (TPR) repeat protein
VVGNCFSLQRETDTAIKYFQRALQLDNRFVYAHTLCGHELVNNEDLDKAIGCFRMALLHDDRHYNAWYGLGSIYFRQEKHEMAELHFRRAIAVNPISSVLRCYLSMVLHAQNKLEKTQEALQILADASMADPKNPQVWLCSQLQTFYDCLLCCLPFSSISNEHISCLALCRMTWAPIPFLLSCTSAKENSRRSGNLHRKSRRFMLLLDR